MEERVLGKNLKVSVVGLGCMGFSYAYGAPTESAKAVRMIRYAFECGYTFLMSYSFCILRQESRRVLWERLWG